MDYLYDEKSLYNSFYNQQHSQMSSNQQAGISFYPKTYSLSSSPEYNKSVTYQDTSLTNSSSSFSSSTTFNSSLNSSLTSSSNEFSNQLSTPSTYSSFSSTFNNSANLALYNNQSSPSNYHYSPINNYHYNYFPHSYHNQILPYPNHNGSNLTNQLELNYAGKKRADDQTVKHQDSISLDIVQKENAEPSYSNSNRLINEACNNEQKINTTSEGRNCYLNLCLKKL